MLAGGQIAGVSDLAAFSYDLTSVPWLQLRTVNPVCKTLVEVVSACCLLIHAVLSLHRHSSTVGSIWTLCLCEKSPSGGHVTHFISMFPRGLAVEERSKQLMWLLLCYAEAKVNRAWGYEWHDINMLICTLAWLTCMSPLFICLWRFIYVCYVCVILLYLSEKLDL